MDTTISLESILHMLNGLSLSNRRWLAEHLMEPSELEHDTPEKSDEQWLREFQALPRGNDMTAEDMKKMLRDSHTYGLRELKYKYDEA